MKTILLLGAVDKSDLALYLSKTLSAAGKRVLLVDGTQERDLKYSVNFIDNGEICLTEYEGFDLLLNETSLKEVHEGIDQLNLYDFLLADIDDPAFLAFEDFENADSRIVVTSFESKSIEKSKKFFTDLYSKAVSPGHIEVERIISGSVECGIDEEYIDMQLANFHIIWPEASYHLPLDEVDYAIKIKNQHNKRLNFKGISRSYRQLLSSLLENLIECDKRFAKSAVKLAQRRG